MTDSERVQIERINEISAIARTSWLALLGYLAFIGISLLAVEDADFFVPTRRTDLPLVGVAIPTYAFFLFAPMLAAALYIYLHIHLLKLWDAIADAPAQMDGAPLGEKMHPWIANDYALALKSNRALRPRPLRWLGNLATRLLIWLAGPAVIAGFWWRSMPAHDEGLTLAIAAALLVATHAGLTSWWTARAHLSTPWLHESPWGGWRIDAGIGVALAVVALSWLRTEGGLDHYANKAVNLWERAQGRVRIFASFEEQEARIDATRWVPKLDWFTLTGKHWLAGIWLDFDETWNPLARTDLVGVDMVGLPEAWRSPETARGAFRKTWCEREGLNMAVCDHVPSADRPAPATLGAERANWCGGRQGVDLDVCLAQLADLDRRFEIAWLEERGAALDNLPRLDLAERDLRNASGFEASLVDADLRGARLEGADLGSARLEGANLTFARLEGADLRLARLEGVDLTLAGLERANLWQARLDGANLTWARLNRAQLSWASLEGANLTWAQLEGADLSQARLEGADLRYADFRNSRWNGASNRASPAHFADLRGAHDLTQAQLENVIGNPGTLLPDVPAPDTGQPFHLWSCWEEPPPDIDRIIATAAPFGDASERATLRVQFLCAPGSPRSKTGTPLPLGAPYPDSHPLAGRH